MLKDTTSLPWSRTVLKNRTLEHVQFELVYTVDLDDPEAVDPLQMIR